MQRTTKALAASLLALTLSACGGGGGSGGGSTPAPTPPPSNQAPVASFTTTAETGSAPLTVTLDASASSDSDGSIAQFNWQFGDGTDDAVGNLVQHTYTETGSFTVTLTVTDDDGDTGQATQQIVVEETTDTFTLSGTIQVLSSSAIDSDTNDRFTTTVSNNTFAEAQPLPNPVTLGGFSNRPGSGASGGSLTQTGDIADFYSVSLTGNEQILLTIGDGSADLDLRLWDSNQQLVDESIGVVQTESLEPPAAGDYFIEVYPFSGASNYVLTVGENAAVSGFRAPSRLSDDFVPGELIVEESTPRIVAEDVVRVRGQRGGPRLYELSMRQAAAQAQPPHGTLTEAQLMKRQTLLRAKMLRKLPGIRNVEVNALRKPLLTPNDEFFNLQWHYNNINLPLAWDVTTGSPDVIVAVVDSGVLLNHPDLQGNLIAGYDFISSASRARDGDGIDDNPNDDGDLAYGGSSSFHGTHVAGTIAAESNNTRGVAGVAWQTRIMPLRALGVNGGSTFDILQAMRFAAGLPNDSGTVPPQPADIINLSLGGTFSSQAEQNVINDIRAQGVIIIAAAGNDASTVPQYPASYNGVVSVSATTISNGLAPYSNTGSTIDIAAPGGNSATDINGDGVGDGVVSTMGDDGVSGPIQFGYSTLNGTSMAAPHVAGVAALMKAVHGDLTPDEFDTALMSGELTDDLGDTGRDDQFGYGLINAQKAVAEATALAAGQGTDPGPILSASLSTLNFGPVQENLEVTLQNIGTGSLSVTSVSPSDAWISVSASGADTSGLGGYRVTVDRTGLADGIYRGSIDVQSDANNISLTVLMQVSSVDFTANAGLHYVIVVDQDNNSILPAVGITVQNGEYPFTIANVPSGQYRIFAGTDSDNDDFLCDAGEACGAFATLDTPELLSVNSDRDDINFISGFRVTIGGASASSTGGEGRSQLRITDKQIDTLP